MGLWFVLGALSQLREKKGYLSNSVTSSKIGEKVKEKRKRKNPCIEKYSDFGICHKKKEWWNSKQWRTNLIPLELGKAERPAHATFIFNKKTREFFGTGDYLLQMKIIKGKRTVIQVIQSSGTLLGFCRSGCKYQMQEREKIKKCETKSVGRCARMEWNWRQMCSLH